VITPALLEAACVLQGAEYRLYGWLHGKLVYGEYRQVKIWPLAEELKMNKATAGRGMRTLVKLGYIREGPRRADGGRSYMLIPVRGEAVAREST
jgi:predicted transcriptional regulator